MSHKFKTIKFQHPANGAPVGEYGDKTWKKKSGVELFQRHPDFFDSRIQDKVLALRYVTEGQYQQYLAQLPCSLCGKAADKCSCK